MRIIQRVEETFWVGLGGGGYYGGLLIILGYEIEMGTAERH